MNLPFKHLIQQGKTTIHWDQQHEFEGLMNLLLTNPELALLTKLETAQYLKVTVSAISAWITQKRLRPTKVGRLTRISFAEVQRFLADSNPAHIRPREESIEYQKRRARFLARVRKSLQKLGLPLPSPVTADD
jgi:excisionase family DNA binding protein